MALSLNVLRFLELSKYIHRIPNRTGHEENRAEDQTVGEEPGELQRHQIGPELPNGRQRGGNHVHLKFIFDNAICFSPI